MKEQRLDEVVQFVCGWGNQAFDVACGKVVKHVDGCMCRGCAKSFERGQELAAVQLFSKTDVDLYHVRCLPREYCLSV